MSIDTTPQNFDDVVVSPDALKKTRSIREKQDLAQVMKDKEAHERA